MKSLVSVVITTHNRLALLKQAIDSVINQSYDNMEIIVVDDASDDGTYDYCINNKNIKYIPIVKKKSKGGNYARNLGIKNSKGDYIAFLDDDDKWIDTKVEKQVTFLENNPDCGAVYTNRIIDINNGKLKYVSDSSCNCFGDCSKIVFYNIIGVTSLYMFRRNTILNNMFDENVKYWQEYDVITRVAQETKIGYIDEPLVIYRQNINEEQKLTNNITGWFDNLDYLNKKYSEQIKGLTNLEKQKRSLMIYRDIVTRYSNLKDYKNKRKYLYKIFQITHSFKDFFKFLLNFDRISYMRLKLKFIKK